MGGENKWKKKRKRKKKPSRFAGSNLRASMAAESKCMYWDRSRRFNEYSPKLVSSPINSKYLIKQAKASIANFNSNSPGKEKKKKEKKLEKLYFKN